MRKYFNFKAKNIIKIESNKLHTQIEIMKHKKKKIDNKSQNDKENLVFSFQFPNKMKKKTKRKQKIIEKKLFFV